MVYADAHTQQARVVGIGLIEGLGQALELRILKKWFCGKAFIDSGHEAIDADALVRVDDHQPIGVMPGSERGGFLRPTTVAFVLLWFLRSGECQYFERIATFAAQETQFLVLGAEVNETLQPGGSPIRLQGPLPLTSQCYMH